MLRTLDETMRSLARDEVEDAGMSDGWHFRIEYADDVVRFDRTVRLVLYRGSGPGIEFHRRLFSVPDMVLAEPDYRRIIELFRDEVRFLCWGAKRRHGLVVGQAGKWRKWGRAA